MRYTVSIIKNIPAICELLNFPTQPLNVHGRVKVLVKGKRLFLSWLCIAPFWPDSNVLFAVGLVVSAELLAIVL